ncbi:PKD domain-containing protein [Pseudoalteromonas rubra]|uniref:PKD domain-containing protein n=1 Tax=Pseudoalteromonas rubra TaxID=43658 RepID=UPI002DBB7CCB|nr:REJ domain-containing protein [Pseudoalteromonas rubra]MEC4087283.1 REJ domain-containing protein [Pseudoalteromonas rubra]
MINNIVGVVNRSLVITLLGLGLSACGGGGGDTSNGTQTNTQTGSGGSTVSPDNRVPTVSITGAQSANENETLTLTAVADDPDGHINSYAWSYQADSELQLVGEDSPTLEIISKGVDEDTEVKVSLTVTDNMGAQATATYPVTIKNVLEPFSIEVTGESVYTEQTDFILTVVPSVDASQISQITWTHDAAIELLLSGAGTPELTVSAPDLTDNLGVNFTVNVEHIDGRVQSESHWVQIQASPNALPAVSVSADDEVTEGVTFTLLADASDSDGQIASYSWSYNSELKLEVSDVTERILQVTAPDITSNMTAHFSVTVEDNQGATATASHAVVVRALPNVAPTAIIQGESTLLEGQQLILTAQASDSDGEIEQYSWRHTSSVDLVLDTSVEGQLSLSTPDIMLDSTATVYLEVTDNQGAVTKVAHNIEIKALPNAVPQVNISGPIQISERTAFSLVGDAKDSDGEIVAYQWHHDSNLALILDGSERASLSVTSPDIVQAQEVTFTLTVTDNQQAQSSYTHLVTIEPNKVALTIQGKVTDAPIPFADVVLEVAQRSFTAQADEQGDYQLTFSVDEGEVNALSTLRATDATTQGRVELVSQLGAVSELQVAAGEDSILNSDELFDVNVTNVTTAEYAILRRMHPASFNDANELKEARKHIATGEKLSIASLLKAVIDHGVALPEGATSTLALAQDAELLAQLTDSLDTEQPGLLAQIEEEIKQDDTLVDVSSFSPSGTYYLLETSVVDGFGASIEFNEDQTGSLAGRSLSNFTWEIQGQQILINLENELDVSTSQFSTRAGFKTTQLTLTIFDSAEHAQAVTIDFVPTQELPQAPEGTVSVNAQLFDSNKITQLADDAFIGQWSLLFNDELSEQRRIRFDMNAGNQSEMFADEPMLSDGGGFKLIGTWYYTQPWEEVRINAPFYNFGFVPVRETEFGYQGLMLQGFDEHRRVVQASLIKHQEISFNDINYQKMWRQTGSKGAQSKFKVDGNDNYHYRWHRGIEGIKVNGSLHQYHYEFAGQAVAHCDTSQAECEISKVFRHKLLAVQGDHIAVEFAADEYNRDDFGISYDISRSIHFYRLSDRDWKLGQFDKSLYKNERFGRALDHGLGLYHVTDNGVSHIERDFHCPTSPSPVHLCSDTLIIDGVEYKARLDGTRIELEHLVTEARSYLLIQDESESEVVLCHVAEGESCNANNTFRFSYIKPALNISFAIEGLGELSPSTSEYYYGEAFLVAVNAQEGSRLANIEGCNGYLTERQGQAYYRVNNPVADCEISASFIEDFVPTESTLLIDTSAEVIPTGWYYEMTGDNRGVFYGTDAMAHFSVTQSDDVSIFTFDDETKIPIQLNHSELKWVNGFTLFQQGQEVNISWSASNSRDDPTYKTTPRTVNPSRYLASLDVVWETLIGEWSVTSVERGKTIRLTLNDDHTGTVSRFEPGMEVLSQLTWELNAQNEIRLYGEQSGLSATLKLFEQREGGYAFAVEQVEYEDMSDSTEHTWLSRGAGLLIPLTGITLDDLAGSWRFKLDDSHHGFELFKGGELRSGRFNGAATASFENHQLTVSAFYNDILRRHDALCSADRDECQQKTVGSYTVLTMLSGSLYVYEHNESGAVGTLVKVDIDPRGKLNGIERHLRQQGSRFYQQTASSLRKWSFYEWGQDSGTHSGSLQISENNSTIGYQVYFDNKIIRLSESDGSYISYEMIDSDVDSITLCRQIDGQCDSQEYIVLDYQPAVVEVTISAPEGVEVTSNQTSPYFNYGERLEVIVYDGWSSGLYVSSFEGCGIERPVNLFTGHVTFRSDAVIESCTFSVTVEPVPDSHADRLGITDEYLRECIDYFSSRSTWDSSNNNYMEYESSFYCFAQDKHATDLAGLDKFPYLESLVLEDAILSSNALRSIEKVTNLKELTIKQSEKDDGVFELDLSNLHSIQSIKLEEGTFGSVKLQNAGTVRELFSTADISELDVTQATELNSLTVWGASLTSLDISQNTQLTELNISRSQIQEVRGVSEAHALETLLADNSQLNYLDLSPFIHLKELNIRGTQVAALDLTFATSLTKLEASDSALASLTLNGESNITDLTIKNVPLTQLNTQFMKNLRSLDATQSMLSSIDLSLNSELYTIKLADAQLTNVIIPQEGGNISDLYLSNNPLTEFTVNTGVINRLYLDGTALTSLDLTALKYIDTLDISNSHITQTVLSSVLRRLEADKVPMTEITIPDNSKLTHLSFKDNTLNAIHGLDALNSRDRWLDLYLYLYGTQVDETLLQRLKSMDSVKVIGQ